jgi:hypothetical protein
MAYERNERLRVTALVPVFRGNLECRSVICASMQQPWTVNEQRPRLSSRAKGWQGSCRLG